MDSITEEARRRAPVQASSIITGVALVLGLSTALTFARMYTRFSAHQRLWWDDWTTVLAWLGTVAICVIQFLMIPHGSGLHIEDVPPAELKKFLKLFLVVQLAVRTAIFFARTSILLLFIRIFFPLGSNRTPLWWVILVTLVANFLYTVSFLLVTTLQCVPYGLPFGSTCVDQGLVLILAAVFNIISDTAVLVIPAATIWRLQMSRKRKWATWALFAFGTLAPVTSIIRLGYHVSIGGNPHDKTIFYPVLTLFATAEQGVAMIAGSAPICSAVALRVLRRKRPLSPRQNIPYSQRMWPSRERGTGSDPKRSGRKVPDPFQIPDITITTRTGTSYVQGPLTQYHEYVELRESNASITTPGSVH